MSRYRAYLVPGAMDPFGLFCNLYANVELNMRAIFVTGAGKHQFDISSEAMLDYLKSKGRGAVIDKLKEKVWGFLRRQISSGGKDFLDGLNEAAGKFGNRNRRAKLEGLHLLGWHVAPVYTIRYKWLCCKKGTNNFTQGIEEFTTAEGGSIIGNHARKGDLHLNDATDRKTLIDEIGTKFSSVRKNRKNVLNGLEREARRELITHAKANVGCCKTPRIIDFGGLKNISITINN